MNELIHETDLYLFFFLDIGQGYVKIRDKTSMRSTIFSLDELELAIEKVKEKRHGKVQRFHNNIQSSPD